MALYEHIFLARQDIAAPQVDALVETYKGVIEGLGGKVGRIENWGLKSLTYRKTQADLRNKEGREQLQAAALEEVNRVLKEETGKGGVEAIFFMSFVTQ